MRRRTVVSALGSLALLAAGCGQAAQPTATPAARSAVEPAKPAAVPTTVSASVLTPTTAAAKPTEAFKPPSGAIAPPLKPVTVGGFPSASLRIMAPVAPGDGLDRTARALQAALQEANLVAHPVEVYNQAGGGAVGLAELIGQRRGDGHAAMTLGSALVGALLTQSPAANLGAITPLARLTTEPEAIVVGRDSKYRTIKQLLDDFKQEPAAIIWGGGALGGPDHLVVGLLAKALDIDPKRITYSALPGDELRQRVAGNQISAGVGGVSAVKGAALAGQARILAVTGPARLGEAVIPTLKGSGVNVEIADWRGIVGPPAIKADERRAWDQLLGVLNGSPPWARTLAREGWEGAFLGATPFTAFLKAEEQRIARLLKEIGLIP